MYNTELEALAREAGREVGMRRTMFPRLVGQGRMTLSQARQRLEEMELIRAVLLEVANSSLGHEILEGAKHSRYVTSEAETTLNPTAGHRLATLSEGNTTTSGGARG